MMNLTMKDIKVGDEFKQVKALGHYLFEDKVFVVERVEEDKSAISLSLRSQKTAPNTFFVAKLYVSLEELNMAFEKVKKFIWSDWKTIGKTFSGKEFNYAYKTNGRITFVKIYAYGKVFKGKATCHKDDLAFFDEATGVEIAYERAKVKLMKYEENKSHNNFQKGDRVKVNKLFTPNEYIYANATGTIIKILNEQVYVLWDRGCSREISGGDRKWYINSNEIDLINNIVTPEDFRKENFLLEEVIGDIFTAPANHTILHTIYGESNAEAIGLTKKIIEAFDIKEDLRDELKYLLEVADFYGDSDDLNGDIIIYPYKNVITLITKRNRYDKVSYDTIERGMRKLKKHMENNNIHYLAMPTICCGREGLEWDVIKDIIVKVFSDCNIPITIRVFGF